MKGDRHNNVFAYDKTRLINICAHCGHMLTQMLGITNIASKYLGHGVRLLPYCSFHSAISFIKQLKYTPCFLSLVILPLEKMILLGPI